MRERPIIFSAPMVRAIMEGRKTQTRRVVKPQPAWLPEVHSARRTGDVFWPISGGGGGHQCGEPLLSCPYGVTGDALWMRENFRLPVACAGTLPKDAEGSVVCYEAHRGDYSRNGWGKLHPAIHLPRWAGRKVLPLADIRVERLQDISEADAIAEGARYHDGRGVGHSGWRHDLKDVHADARSSFARLWDDINGAKHPWASNPWVWVCDWAPRG